MEYKILRADSLSKHTLSELVMLSSKEGWTPQGGVCVCRSGDAWVEYYQAMVRTCPTENTNDETAQSLLHNIK